MTHSPAAAPSWRRFVRHYLEMVAAMLVGMIVLMPVVSLLAAAAGRAEVLERPTVSAFVMAGTMTAGMTVWMRYRRHGWPATAEMGAAMVLPFVVGLVPYWAGVIDGDAAVLAGHVLMLPVMVLVMLRRREEYGAAAPVAQRG